MLVRQSTQGRAESRGGTGYAGVSLVDCNAGYAGVLKKRNTNGQIK